MQPQRTEAIVLHTLRYRDYDQIVTIFSRDAGIMKLICKGQRNGRQALVGPLMLGEFIYAPGRGEIFRCREVSIRDSFALLRGSLPLLQAGCQCLDMLRRYQLPGKPAPALYDLLVVYLKRLPELSDPSAGVTSFFLKWMKHEGLLPATREDFERVWVGWDEKELLIVEFLAHTRSFSDLVALSLPRDFSLKVAQQLSTGQ